jgi:hypothetical protein
MTDPATETKSIGLPADARGVIVFAASSYKVHQDEKLTAHQPGLLRKTIVP